MNQETTLYLNEVRYRYEVRKHPSKERWGCFVFTKWITPERTIAPKRWRKSVDKANNDGERMLMKVIASGGKPCEA